MSRDSDQQVDAPFFEGSVLARLDRDGPDSPSSLAALEGRPELVSEPFHGGLVTIFILAAAMALVGALASALRGRSVLLPRDQSPGSGDDVSLAR